MRNLTFGCGLTNKQVRPDNVRTGGWGREGRDNEKEDYDQRKLGGAGGPA